LKYDSVSEFKDRTSIFNQVEVTINGREDGDPVRTVRSDECSYDEDKGLIRFVKNVNAQLDEKTFVRTDELTYSQHDGLVTSPVPTQFEQPGVMTGGSNRLEYDNNSKLLRLTGNVHVETAEGAVLRGGSALFQSKENWTTLSGNVYMQSNNGWV